MSCHFCSIFMVGWVFTTRGYHRTPACLYIRSLYPASSDGPAWHPDAKPYVGGGRKETPLINRTVLLNPFIAWCEVRHIKDTSYLLTAHENSTQ